MSAIATIRCDGCGKTILDGKNVGWIRINATEDYSVDLVGQKGKFVILASEPVDFCCPDCLGDWIKKSIKGVKP
jgi:hypothetical protein